MFYYVVDGRKLEGWFNDDLKEFNLGKQYIKMNKELFEYLVEKPIHSFKANIEIDFEKVYTIEDIDKLEMTGVVFGKPAEDTVGNLERENASLLLELAKTQKNVATLEKDVADLLLEVSRRNWLWTGLKK